MKINIDIRPISIISISFKQNNSDSENQISSFGDFVWWIVGKYLLKHHTS
jgi:hypothetical protein